MLQALGATQPEGRLESVWLDLHLGLKAYRQVMASYLISELAQRAGMSTATLRFYEQEGLLPAARSAAGYRVYDDEAAERLEFIAGGKRIGLPLAEIRELLTAWDAGGCADLRDRLRPLLNMKIEETRQRSAELAAFMGQLTAALSRLDGPVPSGRCEPACCVPATGAPVVSRGDDPPYPPMRARSKPATLPGAPPAPMSASVATAPVVTGCALPAADREGRLVEWRALLATSVGREPIGGGTRFRFPASLAGQIASLAAAESECCAFFEFTLHIASGEAILDVRAPAEMRPHLFGLLTG
jgi:MerR family transcriptional regulator, copper efflux regulator